MSYFIQKSDFPEEIKLTIFNEHVKYQLKYEDLKNKNLTILQTNYPEFNTKEIINKKRKNNNTTKRYD
mgnify:CR=1 FL=1